MLTRDEVAGMRRNAVESQCREVRLWSVVTFQGGPLDGLSSCSQLRVLHALPLRLGRSIP